jgi:osmotically-inducible protein OsmY
VQKAVVIGLFFFASLLIVAPVHGGDSSPKAAPKSTSTAASDQDIRQKIEAKLAKSRLAADHFSVSVSHGVATIEGVTDVPQHKGIMTRMAKAAGATGVRNNVRVSDAGKAKTAEAFARARSKSTGTHTGTSAPDPQSINSPQLPRAQVLPAKSSR